jgi:protein SCO1/2
MKHLLYVAVAVLVIAVNGCSPGSSESSTAEADSTGVAVQLFEGRGLVKSVLPNKKYIVVDHEDIPGFMSAMEMPFGVRDTSLAGRVAPGDSIEFTVEVEGPYIHLIRIEVSP